MSARLYGLAEFGIAGSVRKAPAMRHEPRCVGELATLESPTHIVEPSVGDCKTTVLAAIRVAGTDSAAVMRVAVFAAETVARAIVLKPIRYPLSPNFRELTGSSLGVTVPIAAPSVGILAAGLKPRFSFTLKPALGTAESV